MSRIPKILKVAGNNCRELKKSQRVTSDDLDL